MFVQYDYHHECFVITGNAEFIVRKYTMLIDESFVDLTDGLPNRIDCETGFVDYDAMTLTEFGFVSESVITHYADAFMMMLMIHLLSVRIHIS